LKRVVFLQEFDDLFSLANIRGVKSALKLEEFITVMRAAMGRQGGSDPADLTDKARYAASLLLHRTP
jgi:hypothetical protein